MTIRAIRRGLARVVTDAHLVAGGFGEVTAKHFYPDSLTGPSFCVGEYEVTTSVDFKNRNDSYIFTCRAFVPDSDAEAGQDALDELLEREGNASIRAAIDAARGAPGEYALGGAADDIYTQSVRNYRRYTFGVNTFYGAEIRVFVIGAGAE